MDSITHIPLSKFIWLFSAAKLYGISVLPMFEILGIEPKQFNDVLEMVPNKKARLVRAYVEEHNTNPALALVSGEAMVIGEFGVLDYICTSCSTVKDSFTALERYFNILIHTSSQFKFTMTKKHACLELIDCIDLKGSAGWASRESMEFTFSHLLNRLRTSTGYNVIPKTISFMHSEPDYLEEYTRIFQADVIFDAPQNLMIFESQVMALKLIYTEDSKLHTLISSIAETALKNIPVSNDLENKVVNILKEEIKNGKPSISLIADKLNISRQTLHRKLLDVGTSYSDLIDNFRKNMAQSYLRNSSMSIDDISFLLGYSSSSAFHRSFKRLTGTAPSSFRN